MTKSIKNFLRPAYHRGRQVLRDFIFWIKRKYRKTWQRQGDQSKGKIFYILVVKRPAYVHLALKNVNSLHFQNQNHHVHILCDPVCAAEFAKLKSRLDYPERVEIVESFPDDGTPWQFLKIRTLFQAARAGAVLIDADTIWHDEPRFDSQKVVFLVRAYAFSEQPLEAFALREILARPQWLDRPHYVTGFVSIPSEFASSEMEAEALRLTKLLFELKSAPGQTASAIKSLNRVSEEIGVGLAVQAHVPQDRITTLKNHDGPGDQDTMESLYYGCINQVDE